MEVILFNPFISSKALCRSYFSLTLACHLHKCRWDLAKIGVTLYLSITS